jgi:hypothetical protein
MARGFDTTLGSGATDRIECLLFARPIRMTFAWWSYRQGDSSNGVGWRYYFDVDAAGNVIQIGGTNGGGVEFFNAPHNGDGSLGQWTWTQPAAQVWGHICVTYDSTNVANDPIVYLNGTPVSIVETITPVGAFDAVGTDLRMLGNRPTQDRAVNGMLAEFGHWNRVLTPGEVAGLAKGYSPDYYAPTGLFDYVPMLRTAWSSRGLTTVTGALVQPHPRTIYPRPPLTRVVTLPVGGGPAPTRRSLNLLGVS